MKYVDNVYAVLHWYGTYVQMSTQQRGYRIVRAVKFKGSKPLSGLANLIWLQIIENKIEISGQRVKQNQGEFDG